ncbi:MAG: class I SAM-dependent methyltransferase [Planctomycetota bacterium]|jgi:SAM-dependent methyltransferase
MDVRSWNRDAWNRQVSSGNQWTVPVSADDVARAKTGDWVIKLTATRPVPKSWFPDLAGCRTLCLAAGGGQQGPILSAADAVVTVFDNSPDQLQQDRIVAKRDGLSINVEEGDMADLSRFEDGSFDLIVHPCSNCFVPDVRPVWREAFRVLSPGGSLLSGFVNPVCFLFSEADCARGNLTVTQTLPWSDADSLDHPDVKRRVADGEPLEFGHLLEDQIGGQLKAGFMITGFYEDRSDDPSDTLSKFTPWMIATRAVRPE